ncbi:uncharacterized protein LOC117173724 [Belonocnema kinseyi]|uniref:uncharacterized protein LOC117173724 n=1 Tax=Belonocnema kinseyi TaxID=2817044 RepID=UPI00143D27BE|nr:uncharacterized protein LOC117173724 [Belonocnema kinseyi]
MPTVFSRIVDRLVEWTNAAKYIPEFQADFRSLRLFMDHIFVLNSIIEIHLSTPGRKVFACFADFKRAFPSVNHDLIWSKLSKLGISTKFIRIINSLYDAAKMSICTLDGLTDPVNVICGILQGELLSTFFYWRPARFFSEPEINGDLYQSLNGDYLTGICK